MASYGQPALGQIAIMIRSAAEELVLCSCSTATLRLGPRLCNVSSGGSREAALTYEYLQRSSPRFQSEPPSCIGGDARRRIEQGVECGETGASDDHLVRTRVGGIAQSGR